MKQNPILLVIQNTSVRQNNWSNYVLVIVEIMPDKVISDHKESYLVSFENFHFFRLAKMAISEKITKKESFQNRPNMTIYGLK